MNTLSEIIADSITKYIQRECLGLAATAPGDELRSIFNGPPLSIMDKIFIILSKDGGIPVKLSDGSSHKFPVVLPKLPDEDQANPKIGNSGLCSTSFLLTMRNADSGIPRVVCLLPPAKNNSLIKSVSSTYSTFGISPDNNAGTTSIEDWWDDQYVVFLVRAAIVSHIGIADEIIDEAIKLSRRAAIAADSHDKQSAERVAPWRLISRLWSSDNLVSMSPCARLSLACGFPPYEGNTIASNLQHDILHELFDRIENYGITETLDAVKERAKDDIMLLQALEDFKSHLQSVLDVITAGSQAASYYYGPFSNQSELGAPPLWWSTLSVEVWTELLGESGVEYDDNAKIIIECCNNIATQSKGFLPVVAEYPIFKITATGMRNDIEVVVTRSGGSARGSGCEWTVIIPINGDVVFEDRQPPSHKNPLKYAITSTSTKGVSIKIVCLSSWEAGVVICARTALKTSAPKAKRVARNAVSVESSMRLSGRGRHYIDILTKGDVWLGGKAIEITEETGDDDKSRAPISKISEFHSGFEANIEGDGHYKFEFKLDSDLSPKTFDVWFTSEEVEPNKCESEFDRLVQINRSDRRASNYTVHVNRHNRSADLEDWLLSEGCVSSTYYPLVFGPDYASDWKIRNWRSAKDTIISAARFIIDPRPTPHEMLPHEAFIKARQEIAKRIRDNSGDGNGLIEGCELGKWTEEDPQFADLVSKYLELYLVWLETDPNIAPWCDVALIYGLEPDGHTLSLDPNAILISPLHPLRFAWHCLAQKALYKSAKLKPCPAASILDPDCIPDTITLPFKTATGLKSKTFFSLECNSDYWSVLWNADKLSEIQCARGSAPLDEDFGIVAGGIASGFSVSQVKRALDDISSLHVATPTLKVLLASAPGGDISCNTGLIDWCRNNLSIDSESEVLASLSVGRRCVDVLDARVATHMPEHSQISNLSEDTAGAVRWFDATKVLNPQADIGIIAQLEAAQPSHEETLLSSTIGLGGLIRFRVREQLRAEGGAFLRESRSAAPVPASGDGLADLISNAIVRLENLGNARQAYIFAPSVHLIHDVSERADFVAVSSSAIDPACFLGGWLPGSYLWDYDLPAYSARAGDSSGYYLLSKIKDADREALEKTISRLSESNTEQIRDLDDFIFEVSRRGIPTVRGLASGGTVAAGDLGLFIAGRVLQDEFRQKSTSFPSMLRMMTGDEHCQSVSLIVPVDPFRGYLDDLMRVSVSSKSFQRPDLLVIGIQIDATGVKLNLCPIEVKYRKAPLSDLNRKAALGQARALTTLLLELRTQAENPELAIWRLTFNHLLISMIDFGFRVYSQRAGTPALAAQWAEAHQSVMQSILTDEANIQIDEVGRLIVIDGSGDSKTCDIDGDGFDETLVLCHSDAKKVIFGPVQDIYENIAGKLGTWKLMPEKNKKVSSATDKPEQHTTISMTTEAPAAESQPQVSKGVMLDIGVTIDTLQSKPVHLNLSDTKLNQLNIGVVGDLGTGKTQLLKSLIYQISASTESNKGVKPGFLIFDYKKDYSMEEFAIPVGAKIIRPMLIPINLFDISACADANVPWLERYKFFADILSKIYTGIGPVQRDKLKAAVKKSYEIHENGGKMPTIYDVHENYLKSLNGGADSISSIMGDLVDAQIFDPDARDAGFDKLMDGVVVVALNELGADDRSKNMLVVIMLNMFYEYMLKTTKKPYYGPENNLRVIDSFLLVDEADNIMKYEFDVLSRILLQGREFGIGVILASQYLRHFRAGGTDYRSPLLTWFIHKVPNITAQELSALGLVGSSLTAHTDRIKTLALHECLYKTHDIGGEFISGTPFYKLER